MVKCFLSHSSNDKDFYVRKVAENLKREVIIIDEYSFEKGMSPIEEIAKFLDETALFVIFISNHSLESDWVKYELSRANELFNEDKINRIYPIIIDKNISYDDLRIPRWMKDSLNIQHIASPKVAARKITARLIEISWKYHPRLKERQRIFVGRNGLVKSAEERLDDFSLITPSVFIASGLPSIGRKSFLKYAITKSNLARESYDFPVVTLSAQDSIEDFILKISDLGLTEPTKGIKKLGTSGLSEKIDIAKTIVKSIVEEKERILIEDNGVIVQSDGIIVDWFQTVISEISSIGYLLFCIASRYRPSKILNRINPVFYIEHIYELDDTERKGLLVRYSKFKNIELSQEDYTFFCGLLSGYPEQVFYAVDLIEDAGIWEAKSKSYKIQQYNSDKAKIILDSLGGNTNLLNLVYLIAKFEFISYETLFNIIGESKYGAELAHLLNSAVCEKLGSAGSYIRINDVLRDYISRNRFSLPEEFDAAIKNHVTEFVNNYSDDNVDISDYIFSAQEAVLRGVSIADELLVPSILVKSIKKLYDEERNYPDAISLADRVLAKEKYIHKNTANYARYIKCQCLARLRNKNFFTEVKLVTEPDKSFLYGFYYRISGELSKAEENFKRVLELRSRDPRAIGELVLIYMQTDEYDIAFDLAKDNYIYKPGNPINAINYFNCLIHKEKNEVNRKELEEVIRKLSLDASEQAQEMVYSARARLLAYHDQDYNAAFTLVEEAIDRFTDAVYPCLLKAELAANSENKVKLSEAVEALGRFTKRKAQTYRTYIKYKAFLMAFEGDSRGAVKLVNDELSGFSDSARKRILARIDYYLSRFTTNDMR